MKSGKQLGGMTAMVVAAVSLASLGATEPTGETWPDVFAVWLKQNEFHR